MNDLKASARKIADFVNALSAKGGLRLRYRITAGGGAADPEGLERRDIYVELEGPDAPLLIEREGEVLRALEQVASQILRLDPLDHDRISFDAEGFKANRARALKEMAKAGVESVRATGQPYSFNPMSSRERRMLHLALKEYEDMRTESNGEGARRMVVLYPLDWKNTDRARATAQAFRRR
ncbi:protein jag [Terriglobus saanensis]|uniref:Single-stranded nucleic acid binding R3H domain-containing protein n=1 Tax=Terriglobus saanensis (strain ATCC BAA-1853 / DSM 23119 / SP1PR4) TaxID=401053 RepID=E8V6Z4_TERSS|nr:R3H domain-containing nucleic acid-binding protein [Terriglobus saanensis]ADV85018.1 single-stranded nucleic acid binding R3H domain-containing protein [Terriglobus saanensis SP1PR4]